MLTTDVSPAPPFLMSRNQDATRRSLLRNPLMKSAECLLGLQRCQHLYDQLDSTIPAHEFPRHALKKLNVDYQLAEHELERIPASGPCVLIANHPFGGIEGLILIDLLTRIRPDFKIMANYLLSRIPQLRERLIQVDPFGGETAARTNLTPLRQSLSWLKQGGLLVIFPAGEVSSPQPGQGVCDPPWSSTLPRLVRMSKAPVLPVYFPGTNGPLFQLAGRVHPRLRTLLLPRMLLNKAGRTLELRVGNLLPAIKLGGFKDDRELNTYLRLRTYALELTDAATQKAEVKTVGNADVPLAAPQDPARMAAEVALLPQEQRLLHSGDLDVLWFRAEQAPALLQEIGRLRELTFRQVGEGTGRASDLDHFDADYLHLCLWNREKMELVGAYRIGRVTELVAARGRDGLYTATLFNFRPELLERLDNALELGRSFIRPEYQRSYAPLLLLWKGIGRYLVANPRYRYLFGPVSISDDYSNNSRQLMTSTLARNYLLNDLAALVSSRLPVALKPLTIKGMPQQECASLLADMDEVSALVADLEADSKGIPVLLRHYLGLGGRLLAFNRDPDFGDVIDGLILVDLTQTERKQLQRYMERDGYESYMEFQQGMANCA